MLLLVLEYLSNLTQTTEVEDLLLIVPFGQMQTQKSGLIIEDVHVSCSTSTTHKHHLTIY